MNIRCFPIAMSEDEAVKAARGGGNILGRLLYGHREINLRTMYLESRYITYEMTYAETAYDRLRGGRLGEAERQKIRIMVEGTTCTAAYVPDEIVTEERDVPEESIQLAHYDDRRLTDCGGIMAKRMVRRQLGRSLTIRPVEVVQVFRPFYIAIYGEMVEGRRARYLPIQADGNRVSRTF